MPNNCSSILKKISYIFFLFFIVSCASLNNDIKSTPFTGKLLINQNNVEQFSFNININVAKNISIIQLKKPFYGNVLEIKVQDGKNLIFLPTESSQPFIVPKSVNRNFKYWIKQCLFSKSFRLAMFTAVPHPKFAKNNYLLFIICGGGFLIHGRGKTIIYFLLITGDY